MPCSGMADDHCCYLNGKRCPYSVSNIIDDEGTFRKWGCGLRAAHGNWDDVLKSKEYKENVAPFFEPSGINCRDWPEVPGRCGQCKFGWSEQEIRDRG